MTTLFVDDDEGILAMYQSQCEEAGIDALFAPDADEAIRIIREGGVTHVICDGKIPVSYGHHPAFFRWHVSGDCPDRLYAKMVVIIARNFPETKFLIFTKRYDWFKGRLPANLSVVFSCWPGLELPKSRSIPRAYMQDGTETRVNGSELECPGNCETCGMCWSLKKAGKNVVFEKH